MIWTDDPVVEFRLLHSVAVGSISCGGEYPMYCWWDPIWSKQLFSVPYVICRCLPGFLVMIIQIYIYIYVYIYTRIYTHNCRHIRGHKYIVSVFAVNILRLYCKKINFIDRILFSYLTNTRYAHTYCVFTYV